MDSPKSIAEMLVDSHASKLAEEPSTEGSSEGGETDEGELAAAEEMMDAFKTGDVQSLVSALRSFIAMIK